MVWPFRDHGLRPWSQSPSEHRKPYKYRVFWVCSGHFWIWSRRPRAQGVGVDPCLLICEITHKSGRNVPDVPGFAPKLSLGHFQGTPATRFLYVLLFQKGLSPRVSCNPTFAHREKNGPSLEGFLPVFLCLRPKRAPKNLHQTLVTSDTRVSLVKVLPNCLSVCSSPYFVSPCFLAVHVPKAEGMGRKVCGCRRACVHVLGALRIGPRVFKPWFPNHGSRSPAEQGSKSG